MSNEVNAELVSRLTRLIDAISKSISDTSEKMMTRFVKEIALCVNTAQGDARKSRPVSNPSAPTYNDMIDSLVEQIMTKINKDEDQSDVKKQASQLVKELTEHRDKLAANLKKDTVEYEKLVEERSKHIISEDLHTGFDSTMINKDIKEKADDTTKTTTETIEVLNNPSVGSAPDAKPSPSSSLGAAAAKEEGRSDDDVNASPLAIEFSKIKIGKVDEAEAFLIKHPEIATEKEKDGLMIEAFNKGFDEDDAGLEQVVHNALILQYVGVLAVAQGPQGIHMFFERVIRNPGRGREQFNQDVQRTVNHIKSRVAILSDEQRESFASLSSDNRNESAAGVEVVQLRSGGDGNEITINIPPKNSEFESVQMARKLFESLNPKLQKALETKKLDEVNKVLENMSLAEGEEAVNVFESAGILNMDGKVYDEQEFAQFMEDREAAYEDHFAEEEETVAALEDANTHKQKDYTPVVEEVD